MNGTLNCNQQIQIKYKIFDTKGFTISFSAYLFPSRWTQFEKRWDRLYLLASKSQAKTSFDPT